MVGLSGLLATDPALIAPVSPLLGELLGSEGYGRCVYFQCAPLASPLVLLVRIVLAPRLLIAANLVTIIASPNRHVFQNFIPLLGVVPGTVFLIPIFIVFVVLPAPLAVEFGVLAVVPLAVLLDAGPAAVI